MDDPYYDQRLANEAAAVEQCLKLGAVILKPKATATGFGNRESVTSQLPSYDSLSQR